MLYLFSFLFFISKKSSFVWILLFSFVSLVFYFFKAVGSGLSCFNNQFYPFFSDIISFFLIMLSFLVCLLSIFSGFYHVKLSEMTKYFSLMIMIFVFLLVLFSVGSFIIFFIIFEFIMMPMILIIGMWGSQPERLVANYYFFFYTLIGGIPLMVSILYLLKSSENFFLLMKMSSSFVVFSMTSLMFFILAFLCKLPMYGVHIWLPKAHVEAPVGSSMVLASLLLKMSSYGVVRIFMLSLLTWSISKSLFFFLLIVSMLYPMLICLRQVDLKSFIAYSSISHMAIALIGLLMFNFYSMLGGLIVFLGHGLISPLMFYSANLIYERLNTRMVVSMGGLEFNVKSFFLFFLLAFVANMGYPPFVSFFGELSLYFSLISLNFFNSLFIFFFILFSSVVMIYYVVKIFKGNMIFSIYTFLTSRELMIYWISFYLLFFMTFMMMMF